MLLQYCVSVPARSSPRHDCAFRSGLAGISEDTGHPVGANRANGSEGPADSGGLMCGLNVGCGPQCPPVHSCVRNRQGVPEIRGNMQNLEGADLIDTPHIAEALEYRKREG